MTKKKEENPGVVRELNLVCMNESIHLMSTDHKENIDFLIARGMKALNDLKERRDDKQ